ncbi:MAG TPA: hypothetical protein VML95_00660 [Longimicrobiales bacterium]|nr:hypothetical protein [Longimicrobiales bacterium]
MCALLLAPRPAAASQARDDLAGISPAVATAVDAAEAIQSIGPRAPAEIWPGFRPDTLAVVFGFAQVGWLLSGWGGPAPEGFAPLSDVPGAAWRSYAPGAPEEANTIRLDGRPWIFYGGSGERAVDLGNGVHEAFHLLQRSLRAEGRYPPGENSFRVVSYPEFDVENEAGLALEGRLLAAALAALPDTAAASAAVREFVAVRERRQRRLAADDAVFEARTELNEGIAQYAYVRALQLAARDQALSWRREAAREIDRQRELLEDLIGGRRRSVRLRFYATGFAQALLLDALAGPGWKRRVAIEGPALQDLLADAAGSRAEEARLAARARASRGADVDEAARIAVRDLRAERSRRVAEVLDAPGTRIDIDVAALPGGDVDFCGIDPQNLLQAGDGRLLHARWFRACGPGFDAEFEVPVLHDRNEGRLTAVAAPGDLEVLLDGRPLGRPGGPPPDPGTVRVRAAGVSIDVQAGRVELRDGRLILTVLAGGD